MDGDAEHRGQALVAQPLLDGPVEDDGAGCRIARRIGGVSSGGFVLMSFVRPIGASVCECPEKCMIYCPIRWGRLV